MISDQKALFVFSLWLFIAGLIGIITYLATRKQRRKKK